MEEYLVTCWNCSGEFDALSAVWCNCDPRNPTKLCPFCMHCFCTATPQYIGTFWRDSPESLRNEVASLNSNAGQLGQMLVSQGLLTVNQLVLGLGTAKATGRKLGESLVASGFLTQPQLEASLEKQAAKNGTAKRPEATVRPDAAAPASNGTAVSPTPLSASSADLIKDTLNNILLAALKRQASALYFEPSPTQLSVRARIDGVLFSLKVLPIDWLVSLMQRLKRLAKLNPEETRIPQTGRMTLKMGERTFDLVLQTLPSAAGEGAGLRIISRDSLTQDVSNLGFNETAYATLMRVVESGHGLVLLTGPLFNSVTETAYSILHHHVLRNRKVVTLESPIMSPMAGMNQLEINDGKGFDFVQGLKSVLNLSPDVLFLSELPNGETLKAAARMAAGVQVIAMLDSPSTFDALDTLKSFGTPLAQSLSLLQLIVSQRVIRRNCPHCLERKPATPALISEMGNTADEVHLTPEVARGRGCPQCNDLGYSGRKVLFETLVIDDEIRQVMAADGPREELEKAAVSQRFTPLRMLHLREVAALASSPEEFIRCGYPKPAVRRIYRVK